MVRSFTSKMASGRKVELKRVMSFVPKDWTHR